ncbi:hypothetical protein AAMO2058_000371000 [Amorphochlora amoebiformis]|mmetsp:Transcript_32941/g.52993  ORF Transcript_32941/g.52993 Transcript_32941/m.52993 type:complete len:134 (-) Transcript_32941:94-495(-)|eukprot:1394734-Amorphochlora_amoeboformis.AAC.2
MLGRKRASPLGICRSLKRQKCFSPYPMILESVGAKASSGETAKPCTLAREEVKLKVREANSGNLFKVCVSVGDRVGDIVRHLSGNEIWKLDGSILVHRGRILREDSKIGAFPLNQADTIVLIHTNHYNTQKLC